jgi:hypothetical protein
MSAAGPQKQEGVTTLGKIPLHPFYHGDGSNASITITAAVFGTKQDS